MKSKKRSIEDLIAKRFYKTIHSRYIKAGIIKARIRRISEYYNNGKMSKEDFDRVKNALQLRLESI